MILSMILRFGEAAVRVPRGRRKKRRRAVHGAIFVPRYFVALAVGGVVRTAPHGSFFTFLSGILLMPDL